jgi:hypothetical protein
VETVRDFEDILVLLGRHEVRYLVVGGLAFTFHARPRYTKDIDLWIDAEESNVVRANEALAEFGSPEMLDPAKPDEILQLGVPPNRIDLLRSIVGSDFASAWERRIVAPYGAAAANWIDLDELIAIKSRIDHPRHREDVRILEMVRAGRQA